MGLAWLKFAVAALSLGGKFKCLLILAFLDPNIFLFSLGFYKWMFCWFFRSIPEGDVLLHTGDFTMRGDEQEVINFNQWLGTLPHKHKIVIAGNHELSFDPDFPKGENRNSRSGNTGKNGIAEKMKALLTNCIYLEDSSVTIYGVKIYGSPYQPEFGNWAFPLKRGQVCE